MRLHLFLCVDVDDGTYRKKLWVKKEESLEIEAAKWTWTWLMKDEMRFMADFSVKFGLW